MTTHLSSYSRTNVESPDLDLDELTKTLVDNFDILANDVQLLSDRNTILEHKLRFAHDQYQHLADKYVPSDPEISSILAKLQLPTELKLQPVDRPTFVPLPPRKPVGSKQKTAEAIRDGRKASKKLAWMLGGAVSDFGERSTSGTSNSVRRASRLGTSVTTPLEQDFTVPGKRSLLLCPFSKMANRPNSDGITNAQLTPDALFDPVSDRPNTTSDQKTTLHDPAADPICAALYAETHASPSPSVTGSAAKCPIRFLDQHSPEEMAKYFETHKHEIPRSHEVCVKRYQRNEEDIRKLDAKYGNLVSMINGLGQKHQPMLPVKEDEQADRDDRVCHERVESWAKTVSVHGITEPDAHISQAANDDDRQGRFDRPMKEIRVGESPSRPWGISVPHYGPPAGHDALPELRQGPVELVDTVADAQDPKKPGKCPFTHGQEATGTKKPSPQVRPSASDAALGEQNDKGARHSSPAFIKSPEPNTASGTSGPQMIFTGPVFIGYPVEQAMALMQQWQNGIATD